MFFNSKRSSRNETPILDQYYDTPIIPGAIVPPGFQQPQSLAEQLIVRQNEETKVPKDQRKPQTVAVAKSGFTTSTQATTMCTSVTQPEQQQTRSPSPSASKRLSVHVPTQKRSPKSQGPKSTGYFSANMIKTIADSQVVMSSKDLNSIEHQLRDFGNDPSPLVLFTQNDMNHCVSVSDQILQVNLIDTTLCADGSIQPSDEFRKRLENLDFENRNLKREIRDLRSQDNRQLALVHNRDVQVQETSRVLERMSNYVYHQTSDTNNRLRELAHSVNTRPPERQTDIGEIMQLAFLFAFAVMFISYIAIYMISN